MIVAQHLTKRYGERTAVEDLSFTVRPGVVTGFLGPNGAGKSTTLRMLVGLDHPTSGSITVGGRRYADLPDPLRHVGLLIDAKGVHRGRSAHAHLLALAQTHGIPESRVRKVLDLVGLGSVAHKRAGVSPWAWGSGWASPPPCSATPRSSSWTSRSTASTPTACCGCAGCSPGTRPAGAPCSSPPT